MFDEVVVVLYDSCVMGITHSVVQLKLFYLWAWHFDKNKQLGLPIVLNTRRCMSHESAKWKYPDIWSIKLKPRDAWAGKIFKACQLVKRVWLFKSIKYFYNPYTKKRLAAPYRLMSIFMSKNLPLAPTAFSLITSLLRTAEASRHRRIPYQKLVMIISPGYRRTMI